VGARAGGMIHHPPELQATQLSLHGHRHVAYLAVGVNPAEIVQHPPIHGRQVWQSKFRTSRTAKKRSQLVCGDGVDNQVPYAVSVEVYPSLQLLPLARERAMVYGS